jgi:HlyD family secretion protein
MRHAVTMLAAAVAIVAAAAGGWYWYQSRADGREVKYQLAKIERGPIAAAVVASGTLNAVSTVQVVAQIAGQLKELYADFNTPVKRGQVLARIDATTYELRVNQARADLEAAESSVALGRSGLSVLQAERARVESAQLDAQREFERKKTLVEKNFISRAELDKARALLDAAREHLKSLEAQIHAGESQVRSALAAVKLRESLLRQAQTDLERTVLRAPVDGTIILRNIDAGQSVSAGPQAPLLFTIAQDLREMQVEAAIGEADARRLRAGMPAAFTVDAVPRRSFSGDILQVRMSSQSAQHAAGYTMVISAANPDLALLPGMTANIRVLLESRDSVLKVPNAALRFRPATEGSRVWVLEENVPRPVPVRLGLSDGTSTEVLDGALTEGTRVIVALAEGRPRGPSP